MVGDTIQVHPEFDKISVLGCCLGSLTVCGCRDLVVRRLAFAPPKKLDFGIDAEQPREPNSPERTGQSADKSTEPPKAEDIIELVRKKSAYLLKNKIKLLSKYMEGTHYTPFNLPYASSCVKHILNGVIFKQTDNTNGIVFIYSHGNAADVDMCIEVMGRLSEDLQVDVVVYDYPGYGKSTGKPSEKTTFSALRMVYDYVVKEQNYAPSKVILYGQSIGSGPAIDLACDPTRHTGGLILHCPIASGLRVMTNDVDHKAHWFDIYKNLEKISGVQALTFVMHATDDEIVSVEHGLALARRLQQTQPNFHHPPWWVPEVGHNDIESRKRKEYLVRLRHFLAHIK